MLLHVLIWATALMLLVQSNIFCEAYSINNNNNKVSPNNREIKSAFMLDEVADFDEIQEPDEEYNGQRNVMLNDISNFVNNFPSAQTNNKLSGQTVKYESQQENPSSAFPYEDKVSSREYVNRLITPKFNVTKDIQNNFHLNQGTTTNQNNKNCGTTTPSLCKTIIPPPVEVDMTPDTTPMPSPCNDSLKNPCDKPVQCIQNLNINQQHIQILIQQCKENATTTETPSKSLCTKLKKFKAIQRSSASAYDSVTSPTSAAFQLPKNVPGLTITFSSKNNILKPKYLSDQLQLLAHLTTSYPFKEFSFSHPEKKYFSNPDKRFINFYPTTQERSPSTKNTILKLNELEDEDYVEDLKHTNVENPGNHLRHLVKNIIENTVEPAENPYSDDTSENPLNVIEKRFKSKNFLRQLSNNIDIQRSNIENRNSKLKHLQIYDNSDFKPYQDNKIYNRYSIDRPASMLTSASYRDVTTIHDYSFSPTPRYVNYQELNSLSNKENVNNLHYQNEKSKYYFKALQDYELHHKVKEIEPNYVENGNRLSNTDFQSNFKPYYPIQLLGATSTTTTSTTPTPTTNYDLLIQHNNPQNILENNNIPYFASPAVPHNIMPEMGNRPIQFSQKNLKDSRPFNNYPTDFRKLYMQQSDENYDVQPNFKLDQDVTAREPILNPRKVQPPIEHPFSGEYYFFPNYPGYNRGFGYPANNDIKAHRFKRKRRKNYINALFNKRQLNKKNLESKFRPVRAIRQIHNLLPKPRACGGYKNDSDCKNYLHNADIVLQLVQKLEYALSQQASKCTTTEASSCNKCSAKNKRKLKRNLPFILPIIFANSPVTEAAPVANPLSNIQLQVNPELVEKIEAMKLGIQNAMSPVSIVKLNNRESKEDVAKLNPVLLQKLDELKRLIEMAGNVKRKALRSEREENLKSDEENKFDFDYDIITKRDIELQEKLNVAKLNLVSALKPNADNRNIFIPNWLPLTTKAAIERVKKNINSIYEHKDYSYDNYYNDDELLNVADHPVKKRNLDFSTTTPVPIGIQVKKRTIHLLAMKKLLESIVDMPFFLHQSFDNNSISNFVNETTTNCDTNTTNITMSDQNFTSTPFTIKIEGLVNLSISSMISLYTPIIENVTNITTPCTETTVNITESNCLENTTGEYSTTCNGSSSTLHANSSSTSTLHANSSSSSILHANSSNSAPHNNSANISINSDKIFQDLILKVLNVLSLNDLSQLPNFKNISINSEKSLNHSVEQNTTFSTTHVVDVNAHQNTTIVNNTTNITDKTTTIENTTKKCDKNITSKMTTHITTTAKTTTVHKTVTTTSPTEETETTTECPHKKTKPTKKRCTTKNPVHVFVLSTRNSDEKPDISLFGNIVNLTPSFNGPVVVRKRSKVIKSKKCCTTKEYHNENQCNNQSSTTPPSVDGNPIDITKERLSLLLNIIRKSSTISPTTNCTSTTTTCATTCSNRKCVGKREVSEKSFKHLKVRSPKNSNLVIDNSAIKLISLAEHSLQLAEKYMQNQRYQESHNLERGDTTTTMPTFLFDQNYPPVQPRKFKYNLFTPASNFFPMYILKTPQTNLVSPPMGVPYADLQTNTPSMIITSNTMLNYNHTTAVCWPSLSDTKNVSSLNSPQGITKKAEDKSEIPEYIVPMYSELEETDYNLNSDYLDDPSNEKVAISKAERLKRDIKVVDEIQDILDKMKLETKINSLKKGRSGNIKKRSIENLKTLLPGNENINSIETSKYNNPKSKLVKPFDMYVIGNSDLTKDYKKRFLMFKKNYRKRKHRKKKERTWKRLFGRSATMNPEHFLNQQTQNL